MKLAALTRPTLSALILALPVSASVLTPAPSHSPTPAARGNEKPWQSRLEWHRDFGEAMQEAKSSNQLILAYIPKLANKKNAHAYSRFEEDVLGGTKFRGLSRGYVLFAYERGRSRKKLPVGARSVKVASQSLVVLDSDGWALGCIERKDNGASHKLPGASAIKTMQATARKRKSVRQSALAGGRLSGLEWLEWTVQTGQEIDLGATRERISKYRVAAKSKGAELEVGVVLNRMEARIGKRVLAAKRKIKRAVGKQLWPYFAADYRPTGNDRDWDVLWCLLEYAESAGNSRDYQRVCLELRKKGACLRDRKAMKETLTRLKGAERNRR